jgi:glyoxylase-like metal-dependent hydrolase (beta-lactamase superfamily II)
VDTPALVYPIAGVPAPAQLLEAAPGVKWLRMPLPFALDHINLWLIEDGDTWTAVDTGYGTETTRALWRTVFAAGLAGRPIGRIVVTHYHPDHLGAAAWLASETGAPVYMTREEYATARRVLERTDGWTVERGIAHLTRHGLSQEQLRVQETRGNSYRVGVPSIPDSVEFLSDGDVLEIGGCRWQVHVVRGHAPEHAMLYCADTGTLISGDQVLPKISTNVSVWANDPDGDPLARFLESLDGLLSWPAETRVLPSHGAVFHGMHARIAQLKEHHRDRLAVLAAALDSPRTAAEVIPVLFHRKLDDHQLAFAIGESIAHLNHLLSLGRVRRFEDAQGRLRFQRTA